MNYAEQQAEWITQQILQELAASKKTVVPATVPVALNIPMGVSNRHVHLCREDMDILFGYDSALTRSKALKQPGQCAAGETMTLHGPKGEPNRMRVLGPLRNTTQVEISVADGFALDTEAPVRISGDLLDSPSIEIIDPKGRVVKHNGMIVAWRHIHVSPKETELHGLHDRVEIDMQTDGPCGGMLSHVVVRVTAGTMLELHIDMKEASGIGLRSGDAVHGIKRAARHG